MRVPGSNLLKMALKVIHPQEVLWAAFQSRSKDATGNYVYTFADPVALSGSWRIATSKEYKDYGLDLAQTYYKLLVPNASVTGVERYRTGDRIYPNGLDGPLFTVENINNWESDGWLRAFCIRVVT